MPAIVEAFVKLLWQSQPKTMRNLLKNLQAVIKYGKAAKNICVEELFRDGFFTISKFCQSEKIFTLEKSRIQLKNSD